MRVTARRYLVWNERCHVLSRITNHILMLSQWTRSVGFSAAVNRHILTLRTKFWEPSIWHVRPRQMISPLTARLRGSSDLEVFEQVFVSQQYLPLRHLQNVSVILDLGANVGFSSAYFLNNFPNARVIAVEPDHRNIAVCRENLAAYGDRAVLLHGAVWSAPTSLCLSKGIFGDGREWATQVFEPTDSDLGADISAWDLASIMKMTGVSVVDLLKVDIEGAEQFVFGDESSTWLPKVRNICIELHGKECEEAFFRALADYDYDLGHSGELTVCLNLREKKHITP
jgi:FkbM family methyltransferase